MQKNSQTFPTRWKFRSEKCPRAVLGMFLTCSFPYLLNTCTCLSLHLSVLTLTLTLQGPESAVSQERNRNEVIWQGFCASPTGGKKLRSWLPAHGPELETFEHHSSIDFLLIIFVALLWALSNSSITFLCWRPQNWICVYLPAVFLGVQFGRGAAEREEGSPFPNKESSRLGSQEPPAQGVCVAAHPRVHSLESLLRHAGIFCYGAAAAVGNSGMSVWNWGENGALVSVAQMEAISPCRSASRAVLWKEADCLGPDI